MIEEKTIKSKLEEEIKKIKRKKSTSIKWYNLDNEIEKIKDFPTFEEREILSYEFQKLLAKQNKSIINTYDKDLVIYKVLEIIISENPLKVSAAELKKKEYFIDSGVKNAVDKSLKVLEFYEVVNKNKIYLKYNEKEYTLNLNKWFTKSKYRINENEVLAVLAPLITSYINIGFIKEFNIEVFFEKISKIIEYAIQPSITHNKCLELEYEITYSIERKEVLELYVKKENTFEEIYIFPISIIFHNGKKYLRYKDSESTKYKTRELEDFKLELEEKEDINLHSNLSTFTIDNKLKKEPKKPEEIKLILECDSVVYEYFNMLPLSNMVIYDEEEKLKEFSKKYNYDYLPNKFYIEAIDYKEKCISVIFHCLEYVKILEPTSLNEDIVERMKIFAKKNNLDICKEDTPPTPPKKPNKNNSIKEEKTDKKINNENKKIDGDGAIEEIKKDNDNLNLDF